MELKWICLLHCLYDAADSRTTPELQPVWNNLLKRLDGVSREYDGFGRMTVRHDTHRRVTQRFSYDDEHRISRVEIDGDAEFTKAEYRYDALGRRTEKQVWRRHARKPERTQYAWSGLQMVGETSDSHPDAAVQYIYTENSYEPLARVDSHGEHADIFWYHTELNGLPDSVTDSNGDTVWRGASTAWGRSLRESTPVDWGTPQNLRFQGQYLDRETGLHYNTFRYYDPAGGCYTQMDPIGLLGGLNTYTYVIDPLGWVDPLGLSCLRAANGRFRSSLNIGEEMASLPNFSGKTPGQIRRILRSRGYTSSPAHSGGEIWMKNLPDGNTASIRIDPRKVRTPPLGYADETPHFHKESVPTDKVSNGNYKPKHSVQYNDQDISSSKGTNINHAADVHIPMKPTRYPYD